MWLIPVHHKKAKNKDKNKSLGSQNLKVNNFKTEHSLHFRYNATPFGNQFPMF
jgi:hypothetical protein